MSNQHTYKTPYSKEFLHDEYWMKNLTIKEIAEKCDSTFSIVQKAMKRHGIKTRDNSFSEELKQEMISRYLNGESARAIGRGLGLQATSITRVIKSNGITLRDTKSGENHPMWKGGRVDKGSGYIGIWKPEHERVDHQGYVYEHTLVMESMIGRLPNKDEVVHHIDFNKHNNDPENLYLCGYRQHTTIHRDLDRLIKPLLEQGILRFDREIGTYVINVKEVITHEEKSNHTLSPTR